MLQVVICIEDQADDSTVLPVNTSDHLFGHGAHVESNEKIRERIRLPYGRCAIYK